MKMYNSEPKNVPSGPIEHKFRSRSYARLENITLGRVQANFGRTIYTVLVLPLYQTQNTTPPSRHHGADLEKSIKTSVEHKTQDRHKTRGGTHFNSELLINDVS